MKLQNHKKKDILELQIAVRKLKLDHMDLTMQNLEIQKLKRMVELENKDKDKELAKVKKELEKVKDELKERESQLTTSFTRIESQKNELHILKEKNLGKNIVQNQFKNEDSESINHGYLAISFSKPGETKELNKEIMKIDNEFECSDLVKGPKEQIPSDSFFSLSSVTINCDDFSSNSDLEFARINNIYYKHERSGSFNENLINRKSNKISDMYPSNGSNVVKAK